MKKWIAVFLAATAMCLLFAGCKDKEKAPRLRDGEVTEAQWVAATAENTLKNFTLKKYYESSHQSSLGIEPSEDIYKFDLANGKIYEKDGFTETEKYYTKVDALYYVYSYDTASEKWERADDEDETYESVTFTASSLAPYLGKMSDYTFDEDSGTYLFEDTTEYTSGVMQSSTLKRTVTFVKGVLIKIYIEDIAVSAGGTSSVSKTTLSFSDYGTTVVTLPTIGS